MFEVLIENILPITAFLPLLGMALILLTPREYKDVIKQTAFWCSIITFAVSLVVWFQFENIADLQMRVQWDWITLNFGDFSAPISFIFGVDGISILLVMLTTFITPLAILGSWNAIKDRIKEYYALFMLLEVGMIGVFLAGDLFLFYVFWEVMLIPMYLLIGIWGGKERIYASIKFVLFTMFGSLLMLVGIIFLVFSSKAYSFEIARIVEVLMANPLPLDQQIWLFVAFFLAFAIKVPLFPFHTWLPDAHVQAPTAGSVILAGVLLKMGTYGFVRFCIPMFPEAAVKAVPTVVILSIIGIIYGALVAMVQPDVKKLVAYSSVAHMGFVMMGIFALNMQGLQGGMLQMINHGLSTGALFLIVGMLYERRHTRQIADYGGISKIMPVFAVFFMVITLSSIGLPGMNGFVGEFLTMLGVYKLHWGYALAAVPGVILAAVYMLWMYQRVMFGKVTNEENSKLKDINWREMACLIPIVVFVFWIGVYPNTFLEKMEPSLEKLISQVGPEMKKEYSDYDPGLAKAEAAKTEVVEAEGDDDHGHTDSDETEKGEE